MAIMMWFANLPRLQGHSLVLGLILLEAREHFGALRVTGHQQQLHVHPAAPAILSWAALHGRWLVHFL